MKIRRANQLRSNFSFFLPMLVVLIAILAFNINLCGGINFVHGNPVEKRTGFAFIGRGGGLFNNNNNNDKLRDSQDFKNATVAEYVAAMEEQDSDVSLKEGDDKVHKNVNEENDAYTNNDVDNDENNADASDTNLSQQDPAVVGVKSHSSKKSNAVGDPDGDDDDDNDDDDSDLVSSSDISEAEWEDLEDLDTVQNSKKGGKKDNDNESDISISEQQVQVQVELVDASDEGAASSSSTTVDDEDDDDDEEEENDRSARTVSTSSSTVGGGGVGVRLGRRRNNKNGNWRASTNSSSNSQGTDYQIKLLQAWMPHIYFPPTSSAMEYLSTNARLLDATSKSRLDRRTLYANLLLEFGGTTAKETKQSTTRKFLQPSTSQSLQAALSMATQPQWREASPRMSGIRLYFEEETSKSCTLSMQETIAMALAHSLGCGLLILDDTVIASVKDEMEQYAEEDDSLKAAALLQPLLSMAQKGGLKQKSSDFVGTISACMEHDLSLGLDDPFDERATHSCEDMKEWEKCWEKALIENEEEQANDKDGKCEPLPLLIFVRTTSSNSLLKSKSAIELLEQLCISNDSIHLLTLGKGLDASTTILPREVVNQDNTNQHPQHDMQEGMRPGGMSRNMPGGSPFGFSSHNQNASGQNDPEGSRRFNIFLARTYDSNGTPAGIMGAVALPQAGNLFPAMMAIQARERAQQQNNPNDDSSAKADLERWAQMLQHQMQSNGGAPIPPPQFFNASLGPAASQISGITNNNINNDNNGQPQPQQPPQLPPEVVEQTLQQAMSELLDRLAQMHDDEDQPSSMSNNDSPSDLHKTFAQVMRNENLRRGIAENLARAAPSLSDPKCQGVMLSVYVPPPPHQSNQGKLPGPPRGQNNMGAWFQKILNNQEENSGYDSAGSGASDDEGRRKNSRQKRARTLAAAAAVVAAKNAANSKNPNDKNENKAERNLQRLESYCRPIGVDSPQDPVRAKSWNSWIARERGAVVFRQNRRALNQELEARNLSLQQHTGSRGAGSALRQMLSVRDLSDEMDEVLKCAVELEAAKSLRQREPPEVMHENEMGLSVDVSLSQLIFNNDGETVKTVEESTSSSSATTLKSPQVHYIHPSTLETALSIKCRISPSPSGGLTLSSAPASHRTREEIAALAQDKHERALVSQVVSPQDIGVTYDMIGGLSDVKELLRQSITYPLKFPHLYSEGIAREAVKGVLLFGPPGTGKTMLAKAVATEGGASFLSVDASSVENKWLGESEKNAKAVFTLARRLAPCVIFIDEVDSLLSSREGSSDDSAHGTLTSVKTTMMSEWDGLNSGTNGNGESGSDRVIVIGSTNRPFDLDEAVLRRFPRRILVDLPDLETRQEILEVTLAENRLDPGVNLTQIAERLEGYTGSDIKEVCREAVVQISHEQAKILDQGFTTTREDLTTGTLQRLRPVTAEDFESALSKLKRSVSEKGKELAKVWEWNDEYGEIKKDKSNNLPHLANMFL